MTGSGFDGRFVLAALATWRVSHLLAEEDGPWDAVVRLRLRLGSGQLGALMDCFHCLSLWVSAPAALAVAPRRRDVPLLWLALSGAACLLERATGGPAGDDDTEGAPHVLWSEAESGDGRGQADAGEPAGRDPSASGAAPRAAAASR